MKKSKIALVLWATLVNVLSILLIANYMYWQLPDAYRWLHLPEPARFWNVLVPFYEGNWYWITAGILLLILFLLGLLYLIYKKDEMSGTKEPF